MSKKQFQCPHWQFGWGGKGNCTSLCTEHISDDIDHWKCEVNRECPAPRGGTDPASDGSPYCAGVGNFHVNLRSNPTHMGWNLGLTLKILSSIYFDLFEERRGIQRLLYKQPIVLTGKKKTSVEKKWANIGIRNTQNTKTKHHLQHKSVICHSKQREQIPHSF